MFYFVPSWYSSLSGQTDPENNIWKSGNDPWYRRQNAQFDDTVGQIRMFRQVGEEVRLVTLCYAPQERRFLHRQSIYPIKEYSVFDIMQGIGQRDAALLSYRDLPFPAHLEWVSTPYARIGMLHGQEYVRIEFGEDGNFLWAEYRSGGLITHRDYYDDRGFCSSIVRYQGGVPVFCEYFNAHGERQFVVNVATGEVLIEEASSHAFHKNRYHNLGEMIREVLTDLFISIGKDETVILAANEQHDDIVLSTLCGQRLVLSYFGTRMDLSHMRALKRQSDAARMIVTDTERTARIIKDSVQRTRDVYDISPFDTRLSLGKSQRIRALKIFMPLDHFEDPFFTTALQQVFAYMKSNEDVILLAGTQKTQAKDQQALRDHIEDVLDEMDIADLKFADDPQATPETARIVIQPYHSENDVIRILYDTRLILDVRDQPDLYLQIAGISAGIPQVNYRFTRYVSHLKDGYIIQNIYHVTEALVYYLSGLSHWNEALVYCVQEIEKYTGGSLVRQWKERLGIDESN